MIWTAKHSEERLTTAASTHSVIVAARTPDTRRPSRAHSFITAISSPNSMGFTELPQSRECRHVRVSRSAVM
jgi:hypothetical protein